MRNKSDAVRPHHPPTHPPTSAPGLARLHPRRRRCRRHEGQRLPGLNGHRVPAVAVAAVAGTPGPGTGNAGSSRCDAARGTCSCLAPPSHRPAGAATVRGCIVRVAVAVIPAAAAAVAVAAAAAAGRRGRGGALTAARPCPRPLGPGRHRRLVVRLSRFAVAVASKDVGLVHGSGVDRPVRRGAPAVLCCLARRRANVPFTLTLRLLACRARRLAAAATVQPPGCCRSNVRVYGGGGPDEFVSVPLPLAARVPPPGLQVDGAPGRLRQAVAVAGRGLRSLCSSSSGRGNLCCRGRRAVCRGASPCCRRAAGTHRCCSAACRVGRPLLLWRADGRSSPSHGRPQGQAVLILQDLPDHILNHAVILVARVRRSHPGQRPRARRQRPAALANPAKAGAHGRRGKAGERWRLAGVPRGGRRA